MTLEELVLSVKSQDDGQHERQASPVANGSKSLAC